MSLNKAVMAIAACACAALFCAGCSCKCEMQCEKSSAGYTYTTVEMKRSECRELNDHKSDSTCSYSCAD